MLDGVDVSKLTRDERAVIRNAKIGFVFARRGVVPEACSTWFLPRLAGEMGTYCALTGQRLRLPPHAMQALGEPIEGKVRVAIEDPKLSRRYSAALLKGVKVGAAPGIIHEITE